MIDQKRREGGKVEKIEYFAFQMFVKDTMSVLRAQPIYLRMFVCLQLSSCRAARLV